MKQQPLSLRLRGSACTMGLVGCLGFATLPALSAPTFYTDSYTLATTNQNMWSSGAQAGWNYNSNLLGAAWGIYGSTGQPAAFGLNAITGSVDATVIPGIPSICGLGFCTPGIPPVTADTRTGGKLDGTTSGQVGLYVSAQANGGRIDVSMPVTSSLTIGETGADGVFRVSGTNALGGGTITAIAPSFKAGVDGVLNLEADLKGTGCLLGFGCTSTNPVSVVDILAGRFSLVGLDTSQTNPLSVFGLGWPFIQFGREYAYRVGEPPCQGPPTQDGKPPVCPGQTFSTPAIGVMQIDKLNNMSGGTLTQGTLSLTTNQPVLRLTADVTGIAQYALGIPVDVLSPSVPIPLIGSLGGTIINVQAGLQFGLTQEFDFRPQLLTTLLFDKPVTEYVKTFVGYEQKCFFLTPIGCFGGLVDDLTKPIYRTDQINRGTSVNVNLATGADLRFTDEPGRLLERTYFMGSGSAFTSDSRVSIDPTLPIKAGCLTAESNIPGIDGVDLCAFEEDFRTTDLLSLSVWDNTFSLGGFNRVTFALASNPPDDSVPEPSTLLLTLLAVGALTTLRWGTRIRRRASCLTGRESWSGSASP